jgi:hypothetical protein
MEVPISPKLRDLNLEANDPNPSLFYSKFAEWKPDEQKTKEQKDARTKSEYSTGFKPVASIDS